MTGYKGFFYHFLDMKTGERFEDSELSTVDTALLLAGALFCQSYFDGAHPEEVEIRRARRPDLSPRRLAVGADARAGDQPRLVAGRRLPRIRLARLQRGDAGLPARARFPDVSGRQRGLGTMDEHLRPKLAHGVRPGAPGLRAAVRPPVLPRVDRFPQDPGCVHAPARHRLFREQPARDLRPAGLCDRQSARLQGLRRDDVGHHGERRSRRHRDRGHAAAARVFRAYSARGIGGAAAHDDCTLAPTAAVASIPFAPELAIPAVLNMHRRFGQHIYGDVRLPRRVQSELRLHRRPAAARALHPGLRLGRPRLSRHRPGGADRR